MYKYTFNYAKNKDQKCMEIEVSFFIYSIQELTHFYQDGYCCMDYAARRQIPYCS